MSTGEKRNLASGMETAGKTAAVALDFGARHLKMAVTGPGGRARAIEIAPRPDDPLEESALLRTWAGRHQLRRIPVYSAISGPGVNIQYLSFPVIPETELAQAVSVEARQILGEKFNEMDTDFVGWKDETGQVKVIFVASPKIENDRRVASIEAAGLEPGGLTLDGFALLNAWLTNGTSRGNGLTLLLDIGYRTTNLVVAREDKPLFLRDITWGTRDLARALSTPLRLEASKVEAMLEQPGEIPGLEKNLGEALAPLVEEMEKTRRYYQKTLGTAKIGVFSLCGGGALVPGVTELLAENFHMSHQPFPSFADNGLPEGFPAEKRPLTTLLSGLVQERR